MITCTQCGHESAEPFQYCPQCGTKAGSQTGPDSLVGRILNGKYRLIEHIGSGATGTVFLGEHVGLKKRVALKLLHPDLDLGDEALQRFQREGIAAGKFDHPNAIDVFDFDKADGGVVYLAMEYVEGPNLREFLSEKGKLPRDEAFELTRQILEALAAAHSHGIVHRDLKPDNVMVSGPDDRPNVKVLDFGLSKLLDRKLDVSLQTQVGRIMGTPLYMSPEQCAGEETDVRSDLYAVGLLLYEMVAGMRPFAQHETTELLIVRVTQEAPSIIDDHPGLSISDELDGFLSKAMARSRDDRFQTAGEMLQALAELPLQGGGTTTARRRPRKKPAGGGGGSNKSMLVIGALAALVLVVAGFAWWQTQSGAQAQAQRDYELRLSTAQTMLDGGQLSLALENVETALESVRDEPGAYLLRAAIYRAKDDDDTARVDIEEALRLDPDSVEAHLAMGWLAYETGYLQDAGESFTKARKLAPNDPAPLTALGTLAREQGDTELARQLLADAVASAPQDARAQVELGALLLRAGDLEAAKEAFVQAKRTDSSLWQPYQGLAEVLAAQGDVERAVVQYREAIDRAETEPELHIDLSSLLLDAERAREALDILDEAVGRFPREGRLHVLRGVALEIDGRAGEAIEALQRAERNGVDDIESTTLLGVLLHEAGRRQDALLVFQELRARAGEVPTVNRHMGLLYFEEGRVAEATARFESVLEFDPGDHVALYNLGLLAMDYVGDWAQAVGYFQRYLDAGGQNRRVRDWISRMGG